MLLCYCVLGKMTVSNNALACSLAGGLAASFPAADGGLIGGVAPFGDVRLDFCRVCPKGQARLRDIFRAGLRQGRKCRREAGHVRGNSTKDCDGIRGIKILEIGIRGYLLHVGSSG